MGVEIVSEPSRGKILLNNLEELKDKILNFREKVDKYRSLLLESRGNYMMEIVRNHEEIGKRKAELNMIYGRLENYIAKLGNNPKMRDGVNPEYFPVYNNAFSADILERVGPSTDAVLQDLDYILGKLDRLSEEELNMLFNQKKIIKEPRLELQRANRPLDEAKKREINYWNFVNPFWLIWQLITLMWKHKIISTIVGGLILAYLKSCIGLY